MNTQIYSPTPENLAFLAEKLRAGELVAVPAETVYGLAGNGLSTAACERIFAAKDRPAHDPLILHLSSADDAPKHCEWTASAQKLADTFWPGPLTLVLPKRSHVPDIATSGLPSVALRVPQHPVFQALLRLLDFPLAAPSANPFGYISPTCAQHVLDNLSGRIRYILDGGECAVGVESTVLDLRDPSQPRVLRPGVVTAAAIGECLDIQLTSDHATTIASSVAPGQLDKHYSPRTPLELVDQLPGEHAPDVALVSFRRLTASARAPCYHLSDDGSGETAAHNLFKLLRALDQKTYRRIYIERPPQGVRFREALLDRLNRAAQK